MKNRRALLIGLMLACALGIASLGAIIYGQTRVSAANALSAAADRLTNTLLNVETAYRGYLIAGSDEYLQPYREALDDIEPRIAALQKARADFGASAADGTAELVDELVAYAARTVRDRQSGEGAPAAARVVDEGKRLMDAVRLRLDVASSGSSHTISRYELRSFWPPYLLLVLSVAAMVGTSIMVIRHANAARRLSEQAKQLLSDVMARAPIGLGIVDVEQRLVLANATFLRLASGGGLPGSMQDTRLRLDALAPEFVTAIASSLGAALSGFRASFRSQPAVPVEIDRAGEVTHLQATLFPVDLVDTPDVSDQGAAIILSDITRQRSWELELESARDEANAANRAKSVFLANMSHELRTPLTAVLGYCELLEEEVEEMGVEGIGEDLKKIGMNARHLLSLINDVLDLSKIEAAKMEIVDVSVETAGVLQEVEAAAGSLMQAKENRFVIDASAAPTRVVVDELRLRQILLNLIGNAAKFTEKGEIRLTVREAPNAPGMVEFEVSDTGIGMSEEQIAKLFKRFQQADETTTRKYGGTGLGLALSQALTIMMGGAIAVRSTPGQGSTFTVTLPIQGRPKGAPVAPPLTIPETPAGSGPKVLVVDDDAGARELLYRILTKEGFEVECCGQAEEAVSRARDSQPDAILLDVLMPRMDGWAVLQALRRDPATADIPIIMQTLLDAEHVALSLGADGYLQKPLRKSGVLEALGAVRTDGRRKVMVIDDDDATRERMARLLRRDGWQVLPYADGAAALAALPEMEPDLILVDLVMPVMDGHAFIREMRKDERWRRTPVVVMTAEDVAQVSAAGLTPLTSDVIQKGSIPLAELVERLRGYAREPRRPETAEG